MLWRNLAVTLLLCGLAARSEGAEPQLWPVPHHGQQWAFIDAHGAVRVTGPFTAAAPFAEGLARVADANGHSGFIDRRGRWRIRPRCEAAREFQEGLAAVGIRLADDPPIGTPPWGFIDTTGRVVIAVQFGDVLDFQEGLAAVSGTAYASKWGFIDHTGGLVIAPQFEAVGSFHGGLARAATLGADGSYTEGFIDRAGRWAIAAHFREVQDFSEGLAAVSPQGEACGYVDAGGQLRIAARFVRCGAFHGGLAHVETAQGHAFVDPQGQLVLPGPFRDAGDFNGGLAPVAEGRDTWRFMDTHGMVLLHAAHVGVPRREVLPLVAAGPYDGALAPAWTQGESGREALWLDRQGLVVWRFRPDLAPPGTASITPPHR